MSATTSETPSVSTVVTTPAAPVPAPIAAAQVVAEAKTAQFVEDPGITTSEGIGTIASAFILVATSLSTSEVPVQVAAIIGVAFVVGCYTVSRALIKYAR